MRIKSKKAIIVLVAIVLTISVSAGFTLAYFSDYTKAEGDAVLHLTGQTELTEIPRADEKKITITNKSKEPVDMVTRVRVLGPNEFGPYEAQGEHPHWVQGQDGWWYYDQVLKKGESTESLTIKWTIPTNTAIENYDVGVLHESAVARYQEDGSIEYPEDWNSPFGGNQ